MRDTKYHHLDTQFLERWSPRDLLDEPISHEDLMTIFEAARFAPSSYNEQPWRFVYAQNEGDLARFRELLVEGNAWAKTAPVLIILFAKRNFSMNDSPNRTAAFDAGSAWMSLALQARKLGYFAHAMVGYDQKESYLRASVSEDEYESVCMIALAKRNENGDMDESPNGRKELQDIVFESSMI